jgi:hypothetical protein
MFTKGFNTFACEGNSIEYEVDGFTIKAFIERDDCCDAPDKRDCGFWPSKNPMDDGYVGENPPVPHETQMSNAQAVMDAWLNDEWFYCGVCVVVSRCGVELTGKYANAVWGIECNFPGSDNSYLTTTANDLIEDALVETREKIEELASFSIRSKVNDAIFSMNH